MAPCDFATINELLVKTVEANPKPNAFQVKTAGSYKPVSSQEALIQTAGLARSLENLRVRRGDRVAIISENRLEWALSDYAIMGLGGVVVPIYPTLPEDEVAFVLSDSEAKGVVVSSEAQLKKILNVRPRLQSLEFVMVMDRVPCAEPGVLPWADAVTQGLKGPQEPHRYFSDKALAAKASDTASLLYTSGTMGQPKGVVLTHANFASNIKASHGLFRFAFEDVAMSFLPLSHVFERMLDFYYFWQGVSIAYAESFDALPKNLREVRPTVMAVVPRVLEKAYDKTMGVVGGAGPVRRKLFTWGLGVCRQFLPYHLEGRKALNGLRVRHAVADALVCSKVRARFGGRLAVMLSGSAPLSRDLMEFFYAMGLPVYEGYGLTETSPVISVNCPGALKLGTVGRVLPGVEVKLAEEVMDAEGGSGREILVRGPNVTPGYYRLEKENAEAFKDGWFHTGDLGCIDAQGFLTITGRKKNLFKTSGGKYVSPEKLENLFQGHPLVGQIMVLGEARKFVGALIVPNFPRLEGWAREQGISFRDREDLLPKPEVEGLLRSEIDAKNALLAPHEQIRQFALLPAEFTVENGELSHTLKVKRRVVEQRYRALIEELFRRRAPQAAEAARA